MTKIIYVMAPESKKNYSKNVLYKISINEDGTYIYSKYDVIIQYRNDFNEYWIDNSKLLNYDNKEVKELKKHVLVSVIFGFDKNNKQINFVDDLPKNLKELSNVEPPKFQLMNLDWYNKEKSKTNN